MKISSYSLMESCLWIVPAKIKVTVNANLILVQTVPCFRRWYGSS